MRTHPRCLCELRGVLLSYALARCLVVPFGAYNEKRGIAAFVLELFPLIGLGALETQVSLVFIPSWVDGVLYWLSLTLEEMFSYVLPIIRSFRALKVLLYHSYSFTSIWRLIFNTPQVSFPFSMAYNALAHLQNRQA